MSKKILIDSESVLKTIIGALDFCKRSCVENAEFIEAEKYIKEAKEKRFSVLEWHPVSEKPKIGSQIIVRLTFGRGVDVNFVMSKCDLHGNILEGYTLSEYDLSSVIEWAYLPE